MPYLDPEKRKEYKRKHYQKKKAEYIEKQRQYRKQRKKTVGVTQLSASEYHKHKRALEKQLNDERDELKQFQKHWLMRAWK